MIRKEIILNEEAEYPSIFADNIRGDGYKAFYFSENKELYEGNHVIIYPSEIVNLGNTLDEIRRLYDEKGIKAAIFHPFGDEYYHYFEENKAIIEDHGYKITLDDDYKFLLLSGKNTIKHNMALDIRLLKSWDERVARDIILPSNEPWELESTKKFTLGKNTFLFVGFINEKAVIYSTIHKSDQYNCVRFDYILCSKEHRGNGYGSELISYLVDFCRMNGFNHCFHWAGESENIVRKAGFRDVFTARSGRINII